MKTRKNIWPFGAGQPLGSRTSYGKGTAGRRASAPMTERQEKAAAAAKRAAKLDDPNLEKKLKAWYAKGGNLNEFLAANPAARKAWTLRGNPSAEIRSGSRMVWLHSNDGTEGTWHARLFVNNGETATNIATKGGLTRRGAEAWARKQLAKATAGLRNPSAAAAEVYEEFHGMPSTEIVEVTKRVHFHSHLAALGKLEALIVQRNGKEHRLVGFKGAKLCCNERKNQLFVEGGDQALNASDFGFGRDWPHERNTVGIVSRLEYFTTKKHLGSEGGTAIYFHEPGEPERGRSAGVGPDLIYDAVNEALEFSGGTYTILAEGISR